MLHIMNVELYHWYISFKIFNKTVYNEINREKYFCKEGVLLDEFLHILYESKVYYEKFFILLFVSQRHFEWCKVQHNETIYFLYWDLKFFLFLKKYYKLRQNFFFWPKDDFLFLTLKVWNLFEKMRLTSKIFPHNFKSFIGYL